MAERAVDANTREAMIEWARERTQFPDSFGARTSALLDALREARTKGDIDAAVNAAFQIGLIAAEMFLSDAVEGLKVRKGKTIADTLAFDALTGMKVREAAHRGGRRQRADTLQRDINMAHEFKKRRLSATCSDTALKKSIGDEFELSRSHAIAAINRGLKKVSG